MTNVNPFFHLQGITPNEINTLNHLTAGLNENQMQNFIQAYSSRRKKSQDILLFTLLGFVVIAGVQRFVLGQIAMGILYLLTGGFCFIGTVVDLINHKSMTDKYNKKIARETLLLIS